MRVCGTLGGVPGNSEYLYRFVDRRPLQSFAFLAASANEYFCSPQMDRISFAYLDPGSSRHPAVLEPEPVPCPGYSFPDTFSGPTFREHHRRRWAVSDRRRYSHILFSFGPGTSTLEGVSLPSLCGEHLCLCPQRPD